MQSEEELVRKVLGRIMPEAIVEKIISTMSRKDMDEFLDGFSLGAEFLDNVTVTPA